jgi:hypothetical protein
MVISAGEQAQRMNVTDLWSSGVRIVEIGPPDGALACRLLAGGYSRQLSIVDSGERARQIVASYPGLQRFLAVSRRHDRVRQNNADVLILHGWNALRIARYQDIRHARFVAVPIESPPSFVAAIACGMVQFVLGRVYRPTLVTVGGGQTPSTALVLFQIRRPRPHSGVRRHIPHTLGISGFFARLEATGLRHVVLRWFESLPDIPAGEDLDLIVHDDDLARIREILDSGSGIQAVDVYSANGAPGADFRQLAYYPPRIAQQILDRAVDHKSGCRVPSPRDHFLSLAYHALYHKGWASGLASRGDARPRRSRPEHDYAAILRDMAAQLKIYVSVTLEDLHDYLDAVGWQPPRDTLVKLSRRNAWLRSVVGKSATEPEDARLGVFILRREALTRGGVPRAKELIAGHGFRIVETLVLNPEEAERAARNIRGGNWTAGPWKHSGGPPAAALVVYDADPIRPTRRQRRRFPLLANARFLAKDQIRAAFNEGLPESQQCNVVHSSDTDHEAIDYLRIIVPDKADEILARIAEIGRPARADRHREAPRSRAA